MMKPLIVAATIAKNRSWSLGSWLTALRDQSHPPDYAFVLLNDTRDDSIGTLYAYSKASLLKPDVVWDTFDTGNTGDDRILPRYDIANLATLRNEMIARCLSRWPNLTHLFSCDSDVLPDYDVLSKLLAADVPVCAAVVRNSTAPVYNFWRGSWHTGQCGTADYTWRPQRRGNEAELLVANTEPLRVTMCGACVLIRRDVIDVGVRYGYDKDGEDVYYGMMAREKSVPLYVHPRALTRHIQHNGEEWR